MTRPYLETVSGILQGYPPKAMKIALGSFFKIAAHWLDQQGIGVEEGQEI
jgi:hypothetical protein